MSKLKIVAKKKTKDTLTRTIRMSGTTYDRISEIAEENGISFNNVVNQLLEHALNEVER